MSDVQRGIDRWVARQPAARLVMGALGGIGGSLVGVVLLADPLADAAIFLVGLAVSASTGWAWRRQQTLLSLPLTLAPTLVTGTLDGHPAYWVRACLGQGRALSKVAIEVVHTDGAGQEQVLAPLVGELPALIGPLTVAVVDRIDSVRNTGQLRVRVRGNEGDRVHEAQRRYSVADAVRGRFAPAWSRVGRRWEPDLEHWQGLLDPAAGE